MNELKQKRKELGLTQVEAAQICGVSRRSFQYYEDNDEYEEMRRKVLEILDNAEKNRILGLQFIKFKCAQIFKNYPEVRCAYLYGSYARKEATGKSDVDILVEFDHSTAIGLLAYARMWRELKEKLGRDVDLVEDGTMRPLIAEDANYDRQLIYERAI